jgi:hypothetical protein
MIKQKVMLGCLSMLVLGGVSAQSLRGAAMYVAVKSVQLKSSTELFAGNQGTLDYGNQVTVLQEKGKWVEVRCVQPAVSGWMPSAGLTSKRIVSSGGTSTASTRELALAGKGFSEAVEQAYRQDEALDYAAVDALEALYISNQESHSFLVEGHLVTEE